MMLWNFRHDYCFCIIFELFGYYLIWTNVYFLSDNLCWMVCLFFFECDRQLRFFLIHSLYWGCGVCLFLSWCQIENNLFLDWYLIQFKTYYCVLLNVALIKFSKVWWWSCNQFWFFSLFFTLSYLIFEIVNYMWDFFRY